MCMCVYVYMYVFMFTCVCVHVCVCVCACVWVSSPRATLADLPRSEDTPPTVNVAPPKITNTQPGGHGPPSHCGQRLHRGSTCGPTARGRRRMVAGPLPACIGNHLVGGGRFGVARRSRAYIVCFRLRCRRRGRRRRRRHARPHTRPQQPL